MHSVRFPTSFVVGSLIHRLAGALVLLCAATASAQSEVPINADASFVQGCFTSSIRGQVVKVDSSCTTIRPASFQWDMGDGSVATGSQLEHRYAKPGHYTITMQALGDALSAIVSGEVTAEDDHVLQELMHKKLPPETTHVGNPYLGADRYINPDYALRVGRSVAQTRNTELAAKMRGIANVPTAIWLDRIAAIHGGEPKDERTSLENHLLGALAQQRKGVPMVVELVIYNLPNRDCAALSSMGTLDFKKGGLEKYKIEFIEVIAKLLEDPRFASLRFAIILEPDSLPNMVTNLAVPRCAEVAKSHAYLLGIQYAIQRFSQNPNAYIFMDIGHSDWLGWENNLKSTVKYFAQVFAGANSKKGLNAVDGFATNISNYAPTEEVFLTAPDQLVGGAPIKSAEFYNWNPVFDEKKYVEVLYDEFVRAGFSRDIKFLIDTSRNGWGGQSRPRRESSADTLNDYVNQSRIDRRIDRANWCNPGGVGMGYLPKVAPYGLHHPVAAFSWIKAPGESDGSSDPSLSGVDDEGKAFDRMCDPEYVSSASGKSTGALPNAPAAGHWFYEQFAMLINNAYPVLRVPDLGLPRVLPIIPSEVKATFISGEFGVFPSVNMQIEH
jgi:cellulose 1,4-beta-cellobiosidase